MALLGVSVTFLMMFLSLVQASEPDTKSFECAPFWTRFDRNCYRFFGEPKTWQAAEDHCQEFFTSYGQQGHLASVHNQAENKFLQQLWSTSLVPRDGPTGLAFWVGSSDIAHEGTFVWSDGTVFDFTQWHNGQPDNAGSHEDCLEFARWSTTAWNDRPCDTTLPHICQIHSP